MERIKRKDKNLIKGCPPCSLDSFLDKSSIIGIGRRIRNSGLNPGSVTSNHFAKEKQNHRVSCELVSFKHNVLHAITQKKNWGAGND